MHADNETTTTHAPTDQPQGDASDDQPNAVRTSRRRRWLPRRRTAEGRATRPSSNLALGQYLPRHADSSPAADESINASCDQVDEDAGRCHLTGGHEGPHAADLGDAYVTWAEGGELQGWNRSAPPAWLLGLPWTADHAPNPPRGR